MEKVEQAPIKILRKAPYQRRTVRNKQKDDELLASIKEHGILQNLLGRKIEGGIEVVAGNRRWEMAEKAGLKTVPILIRELTDHEARTLNAVENLDREDLDPIDEAEVIYNLLEDHDAKATAALIKKPIIYVNMRVRLLLLSEKAKKALRAGRLGIHAAVMLTRISSLKEQDQIIERFDHAETITNYHIQDQIQAHLRNLADAPFDPKSETLLPIAGPCTKCVKRTGNQMALSGIDVKLDKDLCTDGACFSKKLDAQWALDKTEAKSTGLRVLTDKESSEIFQPHGGLTADAQKQYVDIQAEYIDGKLGTEWSGLEQIEIADRALSRDHHGYAHLLVPRSIVKKLTKKNKSETDLAEEKARAQERARGRMVQAVMGRVLESVKGGSVASDEKLLAFCVTTMVEQNFMSDDDWKANGYKNQEHVLREIHMLDSRELGRIATVLTQRPNKKITSYSASFKAMCDAYGVKIVDVEKSLEEPKKNGKTKS